MFFLFLLNYHDNKSYIFDNRYFLSKHTDYMAAHCAHRVLSLSYIDQMTLTEPISMNNTISDVSRRLSNLITQEDLEYQDKKPIKTLGAEPALFDNHGFVIAGHDEFAFEKFLETQIPIDGWNFKIWKKVWNSIYFNVFEKPTQILNQQFNTFFSDLLYGARNNYKLSNSEIFQFLHWVSNGYFKFIKENSKYLKINNIKYQLPKFYECVIKPLDTKDQKTGLRQRDLPIDGSNLKVSIEEHYNDNLDLLVRQLGFPLMVFYNYKFVYNGSSESYLSVLRTINDRSTKETSLRGSYKNYNIDIIKNSIYFGPYPFEEKLKKAEFPDWREVFKDFIVREKIDQSSWWMNVYLKREPIKCVAEFIRKRNVIKRKENE